MQEVEWKKPETVAKRIFWLAWKASRITENCETLNITEDKLWDRIVQINSKQESPKDSTLISVCYLCGKWVNLTVRIKKAFILFVVNSSKPEPLFQTWRATYYTYADLHNAAITSLEKDDSMACKDRVNKLLLQNKYFLVVSETEPYFADVYTAIRETEKNQGTWTEYDEELFTKYVPEADSQEIEITLTLKAI